MAPIKTSQGHSTNPCLMRNQIFILLVLTIFVMLPLAVLVAKYQDRQNAFAGSFTRYFPGRFLNVKGCDLKFNSYFIAGSQDSSILLGNYTIGPQLLSVDRDLKVHDTFDVELDKSGLRRKNRYLSIVEGDVLHLGYGLDHAMYKGSLNAGKVEQLSLKAPYFTVYVPISPTSYVFQYTSAKTKRLSFRKVSLSGESIENDSVLVPQVDGQFCTSGHLKYCKSMNLLIYVYCYRNQILVMDTNLNLLKQYNTIDHIDTARFDVSKINSTGSRVLTSPTILVNQRCAVYKHYLFVNSKIRGRKEDDRKFERSTVIDIYDLRNGKYLNSLSLPNSNMVNIKQLEIINGEIYVMSQTYLQRFKFELPQ